jgi:serine/threonine protein kinase
MTYEVLDRLGNGSYGEVFAGKYNNKNAAYKVINNENTLECNEFIRRNKHPNIVEIYDCFSCFPPNRDEKKCESKKLNQKYIVVMERLDYEIDQYISLLPEGFYRKLMYEIFLQISKGVKYLHDNGYFHTDLKPQNIMINLPSSGKFTSESSYSIEEGKVKIIDLGSISNRVMCAGTPLFQDFCQHFADQNTDMIIGLEQGKKIDIYQLGATFYDIIYERSFQIYDEPTMPSPEITEKLPDEPIARLIADMTRRDYEQRPNIDEVIKALEYFIENSRI